jgi:GT2 family glycosyltransferase
METHQPSISVVIPNYNGKHLLEKNLPFVFQALKSSHITDFEIIISDDSSKDDSVAFVKNNYPYIILIESAVNVGFGGNCNRAILKSTKELVFLLNSDVQLTEGYFIHLIDYFNKPNCFGVMGSIWDESLTQLQDAAKYPSYTFAKINGATNFKFENKEAGSFTFFLSGANALINREKLLQLKGFEEAFNPYYFEDLDLGIRAWKQGFQCFYEPKATCIHPLSSTIKQEPSDKVKTIVERNRILIHYLHLPINEWCFYQLKLVFKAYFKALFGKKQLFKGWQMFTAMKAELKEKRTDLQNSNVQLKDIKNTIENSLKGEKIGKF